MGIGMEMKAEKRTARPLATAATLSLTPCSCEMRADARAGSIFMSVSLMVNALGMSFLFGAGIATAQAHPEPHPSFDAPRYIDTVYVTLHGHPGPAQVAWFLSFFVLCHLFVVYMPSISFHQSHHSGPKPGVSVTGTVNLGEKLMSAHCATRTLPDHCCITDPLRQGFSVQRTMYKVCLFSIPATPRGKLRLVALCCKEPIQHLPGSRDSFFGFFHLLPGHHGQPQGTFSTGCTAE